MPPSSPPLGLIKPTCILYLHFQAPVKTPPAPNKTVQKSLTQPQMPESQKQSPPSSLQRAALPAAACSRPSVSFGSSAIHPQPSKHPVPPPTATPCPGQPHACRVGGWRAEATPAPRVLDPKATWPSCPSTELETCKHFLEGEDPEHPRSDLAPSVWSLPPLPAPSRDPAQPSTKPAVGLCKQVGPPILPPQRGLPCSCRNIDPDKPGRHIRCPAGVRRSVAQLATRCPVPMGSGMGKGSAGGLGKPLTPLRGPGPKCFCQGEVKQIDEGPP